MSDYEHILVDKEDGVAVVTLNRPEVLNAMNNKLNAELQKAVLRAEEDDEVSCIVITGSGDRAFTAGGDIHEQRANDQLEKEGKLDRSAAVRALSGYEVSACLKPTIGMMNGLAYGGGAVLASSVDMRIGCERTQFRFLAAAYGRINSTWTLPNQVGWPMAKELLFSARIVKAEEAYRIGLLNHLVPSAELRDKTMELAKQIAANDRKSIMGIKSLMLQQKGRSLIDQWTMEKDYAKHVLPGAKAEDAFPDFIKRKGR
jgi:enoyl-CoA hydratase